MGAVIGAFVSLLGACFFLFSGIGLLRMPDAFNRMQAGTKATTLGSILFLLGIGIMKPEYLGRTVILAVFIALTNPGEFECPRESGARLQKAPRRHTELRRPRRRSGG